MQYNFNIVGSAMDDLSLKKFSAKVYKSVNPMYRAYNISNLLFSKMDSIFSFRVTKLENDELLVEFDRRTIPDHRLHHIHLELGNFEEGTVKMSTDMNIKKYPDTPQEILHYLLALIFYGKDGDRVVVSNSTIKEFNELDILRSCNKKIKDTLEKSLEENLNELNKCLDDLSDKVMKEKKKVVPDPDMVHKMFHLLYVKREARENKENWETQDFAKRFGFDLDEFKKIDRALGILTFSHKHPDFEYEMALEYLGLI